MMLAFAQMRRANLAAIRQLLTSALVLMEEERNTIEPWIRGDVQDALVALEDALRRAA